MYLNENSEFHTVIKPDDYLCSSCYKVHLHVAVLASIDDASAMADSVLKNKIDIWKSVLEQGDKDRVTNAILVSALYVADELLQQ